MDGPDRRRRSRSGRLLDSLVWGGVLGATSGAVLYAPAEALTSLRRGAAETKPLWYRILSSALLMALFGWLLGLVVEEALPVAIASGALLGLWACAR